MIVTNVEKNIDFTFEKLNSQQKRMHKFPYVMTATCAAVSGFLNPEIQRLSYHLQTEYRFVSEKEDKTIVLSNCE